MRSGAEFLEAIGAGGPGDAPAWPLVHRAPSRSGPSLESIVATGRIVGQAAVSAPERDAGRSPVVYSFARAGVYPRGVVAFLLDPAITQALPSTLTPYDTGGVELGLLTHPGSVQDLYARWCTHGAALSEVFGAFVAMLFDDPDDYVRRVEGVPDRPPPHGVVAEDGAFSGAWVVEVQLLADVEVDAWLQDIVVLRRDLLRRLPPRWRRRAQYEPDPVDAKDVDEGSFAARIARVILWR